MKKLMVIMGILLVTGILVLTSCARPPLVETAAPVPTPTPTPRPAPMPPPAPEEAYKGSMAGDLTSAEERMIVRHGDMSLIVKDVIDARDEIARLADRMEGYVVSSWIAGEDEGMRGSISIRVPDDKFEPALVELRNLAVRVESESTSSRDVTEEYIDLEARLKNAEATESQYLALLDKAEEVEDILRIYDSLSRVRREIEQIKGRMQYLERTSSMSLIVVQLRPAVSGEPLVSPEWSALETLKSAIRGIVGFGQWLVTVAIWILLLLPIWGTIVGIIYWRARRRKKVSASATTKQEGAG